MYEAINYMDTFQNVNECKMTERSCAATSWLLELAPNLVVLLDLALMLL